MKELIGTYLVTSSETEMLPLNLRSKDHQSVMPIPHFMRDTTESRNKKPKREEQGERKSPLRSPRQRLCEEELCSLTDLNSRRELLCKEEPEICSLTDLNSRRELKPNYYHPQKYDDQMQTQWREKETSPHDVEISECLRLEIKILRREKANVEQQNSELTEALQAKTVEIESLIKNLERSEEQIRYLNNEISDIQKSKRHTVNESLQQLVTENVFLKSTLEHRSLKIETLSKECEKQRRTREKCEHEMTKLEQVVQKKTNEVEDLTTGDKEEAHAKISALTDALYEKKREFESLTNQLERSETHVTVLKSRIDDMQRINTDAVDKSKSLLQNENASLKLAYEQATFKIKDLSKQLTNGKQDKENADNQIDSLSNTLFHKKKELESVQNKLARSEKDVLILSKDIKDMQASRRLADEKLQRLQTENASSKSALSKATNEINNLNKGTNLQKYKTDAEHKTSTLMNALREKDTENEALREQLARAEKNVSILSKDIKDMQASKRQAAEEKLQSLQTENTSLKSALSKATNESEETVSILSTDIKNIQESKRQVADETLQDLQTENDSLKLTLAEATTKIDDLWNKCTNLQKYKSDAELHIGTLLNVVERRETGIETLHKHLARSEKKVSILSKDIKDIQGSKRQAADEKIQSLLTENASIKLELAKATIEMDAFRNECTDLQKYKTDTEHTINTLLNAVKEKETKFETLNKQLARKNNELSKDKENAENQKNRLSKALDENKKEIETMQNNMARYKEKIWTLTKTVKDIKGSKNQAADENIKGLQKKIGSLESELRNATTEMNDLSFKYKCLQKDKESAEYTINKLSRNVQEKEEEISSLIEDLAKANENEDKEEHAASANSIQKLTDENASLRSKLSQLSHEKNNELSKVVSDLQKDKENAENQKNRLSKALDEKDKEIEIMRNDIARSEENVSILSKDIQNIQESKHQVADEKLQDLQTENDSLKLTLAEATTNYDQKGRDSNEVKRERDHNLKRCNSGPEGNVKKDPKLTGLL